MTLDIFKTENDYKWLLEQRLYEELGVSDEVRTVAKKLVLGIATLIEDFEPNFSESKTNRQNASAKISLAGDISANCKVRINYFSDIPKMKAEIAKRQSDAWFEPDNKTVHVIVDVLDKKFDSYSTLGLLQHELTHAYQELMKNKHGRQTVVNNNYENAVNLCFSDNEDVSAAAKAVYFSNYGEMSANANELYPWFYKTVSNNEPFETYLNKNLIYQAVVEVKKLNKVIDHYGANVLKEPSKQLGMPINRLKIICKKFPKLAMSNICRVYAKAKKDYEATLNENALDYAISKHRRYIKNKLDFFNNKH